MDHVLIKLEERCESAEVAFDNYSAMTVGQLLKLLQNAIKFGEVDENTPIVAKDDHYTYPFFPVAENSVQVIIEDPIAKFSYMWD